MKTRILVGLFTLAVSAAGTAGWLTRGWLEDSHRLTAIEAARQTASQALARESVIAGVVEARLSTLDANERIIDRGIVREIQKPIYRNVCLGADALRLLNDAAAGRAPDSTEPADPMPGNVAGAD
ncbi:hypothetical protein [Salinicola aestuarinus]|uniref:hypothetical protein n=1 Tax=Salinicola aestuarinus TaxID=1949082 RepID=UPI000DA1F1D1|nr:hypothetical protein [Salinicola aestuarinus]